MRALGVGFPYAIGNAAFGGTAEHVALSFRAESAEYYFFYVAAALCVTFLASMLMPNLTRHGYISRDGKVEENTGMPVSRMETAQP